MPFTSAALELQQRHRESQNPGAPAAALLTRETLGSMSSVIHGSTAGQNHERVMESKVRSDHNAGDVFELARRAGLNLQSGGLTMTGLLSCVSHSSFDEWMHWMLKDQGRNFKRHARRMVTKAHTPGTLSEAQVADSMHVFHEEKHQVFLDANDDDPLSNLEWEEPRSRSLEQALKTKASTKLDRMFLSSWKGPVDDALELLGNLPDTKDATDADEEHPKEVLLVTPIFANPRGLSAVKPARLSRETREHLDRLAQPVPRAVQPEPEPPASIEDAPEEKPAEPTADQLMEEVRAGRLTLKEYKEAVALIEAQPSPRKQRPISACGASPQRPFSAGGRVTPSQRPRSSPAPADRFARDLENVAAACWVGDARAAQGYTTSLGHLGMAVSTQIPSPQFRSPGGSLRDCLCLTTAHRPTCGRRHRRCADRR